MIGAASVLAVPSSDRPAIDFRTEVLASPTEGMWDAMRTAGGNVGWPLAEGDPWVAALERAVAKEAGHEDALFVPTTSMGNLVASLVLCRPGTQVIMGARSHQYWYEHGNVSSLGRATTRLVGEDRLGRLPTSEVERVLAQRVYGGGPATSMIALENTHNVCGGTCLTPEYMSEIRGLADEHGARVFVDGARILNVSAALDAPLDRLCRDADAVSFSLNKGLGAPFGAMLCGSAAIIGAARGHVAVLGGHSVHRAGMFAAAALHALGHERGQLVEDHRLARALADAVSDIDGVTVDLATVQTNLVRVDLAPGHVAEVVVRRLAASGVGATVLEPTTIRFVAHRGVSEHDVPAVQEALARAVST